MSRHEKLAAGSHFPTIDVQYLDGQPCTLAHPLGEASWQMVVIYRGRHCPICTKFLTQLTEYIAPLQQIGISVIAVSSDTLAQATEHASRLSLNFPLAYGLSLEQMQALGLYISVPRNDAETDHPFSEPALFVINEQENIQVIDIANNPFVRPDLSVLTDGLSWIRQPDNHYPIRGTWHGLYSPLQYQ